MPARSLATRSRRSKSFPPERYPSTASSTFGSIWANRSTTARGPKSGEQDDHTAPRLAQARNAATAPGDVREGCDHPVALTDAEPPEPRRAARRARSQLCPRPRLKPSELRGVLQRDLTAFAFAEDMFGEVQLDIRQPPGARHVMGREHPLRVPVGLDVEEPPHGAPEALEVIDRPAPE